MHGQNLDQTRPGPRGSLKKAYRQGKQTGKETAKLHAVGVWRVGELPDRHFGRAVLQIGRDVGVKAASAGLPVATIRQEREAIPIDLVVKGSTPVIAWPASLINLDFLILDRFEISQRCWKLAGRLAVKLNGIV
jgi:hypothetical protein